MNPTHPTPRSRLALRAWLAIALAAIALLLALLLLRSQPERASFGRGATDATAEQRGEPAQELEQPAREAVAVAAPVESPSPTSPAAQPTVEPLERAWIGVHVVDERHAPVAGAVVTHLWTICSSAGENATADVETSPDHTGVDGRLQLACPLHHGRTCAVDQLMLAVYHPDFAPFESDARPLDAEVEVVLTRGEVLVLSGWIGSPDQVVNDFDAQFSSEVEIQDSDWLPRRDGRRTTTRVPLGTHLVQLRHWQPDGVWWSALTEFELERGVATELHLELRPSARLRGRLGDEVPRPVIDGRVMLARARANVGNEESSGFFSATSTAIAADGSFELGFLPPDPAHLIALCRGWVSTRQATPGQDASNSVERASDDELQYPRFDLAELADEVVVAMEPTAALAIRALDARGAPLPGVALDMYPNACWEGVGCAGIQSDFDWHAVTDAAGSALLENVPAGEQWLSVEHADFRLPADSPEGSGRGRLVHFVSGETLRQTLKLERKSGG